MRHLPTMLAFALLCACDDPGDSSVGTEVTCDQAIQVFCTGAVAFEGGWGRTTDDLESVRFTEPAPCIDRLDSGGEGLTSGEFAYGCAFDDGSVDWGACEDASAAMDSANENTLFAAEAVCRIHIGPAETE